MVLVHALNHIKGDTDTQSRHVSALPCDGVRVCIAQIRKGYHIRFHNLEWDFKQTTFVLHVHWEHTNYITGVTDDELSMNKHHYNKLKIQFLFILAALTTLRMHYHTKLIS